MDGDNNVAAASLLQQLKSRIEHLNRNNNMAEKALYSRSEEAGKRSHGPVWLCAVATRRTPRWGDRRKLARDEKANAATLCPSWNGRGRERRAPKMA